MKNILLLLIIILVLLLGACEEEEIEIEVKYRGNVKEKLLDNDEWNCDDSICTLDETKYWNTLTYNFDTEIFEVKLRTAVDGTFGTATISYLEDSIEVDLYMGGNCTCSIDTDIDCGDLVIGEPYEQLIQATNAVFEIVIFK
ncbi:MAG: hypothetical protein KQ78_00435 [Candidatus Izimaplasma bacterium HR2]|nr:MAG: hypothetical protein KQ78_00435 [Candidatus Izimaplasma bacterium HR2]